MKPQIFFNTSQKCHFLSSLNLKIYSRRKNFIRFLSWRNRKTFTCTNTLFHIICIFPFCCLFYLRILYRICTMYIHNSYIVHRTYAFIRYTVFIPIHIFCSLSVFCYLNTYVHVHVIDATPFSLNYAICRLNKCFFARSYLFYLSIY